MDAASLERAGVATVVIGLPQLLATVGRATADAQNLPTSRFVSVTGDLHHALDYIPEESGFWDECIRDLVPQVVRGLTTRENA